MIKVIERETKRNGEIKTRTYNFENYDEQKALAFAWNTVSKVRRTTAQVEKDGRIIRYWG